MVLGFDAPPFMSIPLVAGLVLISMQKSLSPLDAVDLQVVVVFAREDGKDELKLMSTFTGMLPAARGNFIASNVSDPVPNGRLHVFEAEASPVQ